jgi:hypothetical protein
MQEARLVLRQEDHHLHMPVEGSSQAGLAKGKELSSHREVDGCRSASPLDAHVWGMRGLDDMAMPLLDSLSESWVSASLGSIFVCVHTACRSYNTIPRHLSCLAKHSDRISTLRPPSTTSRRVHHYCCKILSYAPHVHQTLYLAHFASVIVLSVLWNLIRDIY